VIGLHFRERMSGSWYRLESPADERPIEFSGDVTVGKLTELLGNTVAMMRGRVTATGLTRGAEFEGTLGLGALVRERRLPYAFSFRADDGRTYRFDGAKEVSVLDLTRSMTTLPAYLFNDKGDEIGRAVLHFDLRSDLVKFLRSWRPFVGRTPKPAR
jgi:hypothetical protein